MSVALESAGGMSLPARKYRHPAPRGLLAERITLPSRLPDEKSPGRGLPAQTGTPAMCHLRRLPN